MAGSGGAFSLCSFPSVAMADREVFIPMGLQHRVARFLAEIGATLHSHTYESASINDLAGQLLNIT